MMIAKRVDHNSKTYYQSLKGHIEDGLRILYSYFEIKQNVIKSFCNRWNIDLEKFYKDLFLTVALHDIGKLTKEFQRNIEKGKRSHRFPHPLFGIPILLEIPFEQYKGIPLSLLAILGHHSQLHKTIYKSGNISKEVVYLDEEILDFVNVKMEELYKKLGFNKYFGYSTLKIPSFPSLNRDDIVEDFIGKYIKASTDVTSTKSIFTFMFSILQLCDDYSSANFSHFIKNNYSSSFNFDSVITDTSEFVYDIELEEDGIKDRLFGKYTPYKFQKDLFNTSNKFIFLFAPCGRGKTEAALWWAFKLKKALERDKIIFALPTQVTCNAMYERLIDKYKLNKKNVGLFHGKSSIALKYRNERKEEMIQDDYASDDENDFKSYDILRDEVFKGNVFFKPITVTTIDHLAYSFVHGFSQSDFACGNLQNAILIFDEVHYYEKQTLDILLRLFNILKKIDIPHLLMTGTAPNFLLKKIEESGYKIIKDEEGLSYKPFVISKKADFISSKDEIIESIIDDYKKSKNIFVIVNQVEWAQNFYKELKSQLINVIDEPNMVLYHSRFIHKHRVKKEEEIREKVKQSPCILVTTQVIEISLDISCDVMYTTIAPPDAIGQRGGRINRSGKFFESEFTYEVKLFSIDSHLPYPEEIIKSSWQSFNDGAYSYEDIKNVCDEVYKNYDLEKDMRFNDFFKKNVLFGDHYKDIAHGDEQGKGLKIRPDDFQQISVVPSRVYEEAEGLVRNGNAMWAEYEVKIPFYKLRNDIKEHGEWFYFHKREGGKIIECDYEYDYELGIQFNKHYSRIVFI